MAIKQIMRGIESFRRSGKRGKKKLRIAIFTDAFFPQMNGVVVYTVELVNYLASRGHKVLLFVPECKDKEIKLNVDRRVKIIKVAGVKMTFYPDFKFTNILSSQMFHFLQGRIDVINFQTPFTMGLMSILVGLVLNIPIIGTFHTFVGTKEYLSHLPKPLPKLLNESTAWAYLGKFYNICKLVISPSEYTKKELLCNGITPKIDVINIGIDFSSYKSDSTKIPVKENSFVFVGRIATEKNISKLLDAFNIVRKKRESYLYLIGDGPQSDEVKKMIRKKQLEKNVFMLGRVENTIIRGTDLLSRFKAFVTMSNTENQPVTLIEAMRKGLPLIGPKSKGITEMISGNGIIIRPNNTKDMARAMIKLLDDTRLQKRYGANSLKISDKYDSKYVFSRLEKEFKKFC